MKKREAPTKRSKPKLLTGDNPQIPKGDGPAPVRAWISGIPGWKRKVARDMDALIVRAVPRVRKAVKWNSTFYGTELGGFFLSMHCFTRYIKVSFFRGTSLEPMPPGPSKVKNVRYLDIHEHDAIDETQVLDWLRQAAKQPGWYM